MSNKYRFPVAGLLLLFALGGCATQSGTQGGGDPYGALSDGNSSVAYSTAFPVASPEEAYRNGDAALRAGDADRALFEYLRGLQMEDRAQADPLYRVGVIHHGRGNTDLAEKAYRWALNVDSRHAGAGTAMGVLLLEQRDFEQAEQYLAPIASRSDAPWQADNALGVIADIRGQHEQARRHYEKALQANPRIPRVLNNLGYSYYLVGDLDAAMLQLRQAVNVNPRYELAWRNLGLVYARQGDYETAIEAVARHTDRAEAYNDIGYISMLEGRFNQAMGFFEEAMRLSPAYYVTAGENVESLNHLMRRNGSPAAN